MEFFNRHKKTYLIIGIILVLTGAYPIYSLFRFERSPCRPLILACRDQGIIPANMKDRREIFRKCFLPVFETQRLGDVYFGAQMAENCKTFSQRKRTETEGKENGPQEPNTQEEDSEEILLED